MIFVLASASPRRLALLEQIGLKPDRVVAAEIDETPQSGETARGHALRLAREKAEVGAQMEPAALVLGADTVVGVGRRILPKAETDDEVRECLTLLSGRSHRVFTAIALRKPDGKLVTRVAEAQVDFKRLEPQEIEAYVKSGEGKGKAGGYAIQGLAGKFVIFLQGSYSAVVGLPLYETAALLEGAGHRAFSR